MGPPDQVFASLTAPTSPYQDRALSRVYANTVLPVFNFLMANGLVLTSSGSANIPITTMPATMQSIYAFYEGVVANGAAFTPGPESINGRGDTALVRTLENSARTKGVQFLLNTKFLSIIRQQQYVGNVVGISAQSTGGRIMPGATAALQSWKTAGNITATGATVNIKANKAVIICDGGHSSNVMRREEMDPRLTSLYFAAGEPYSYQHGDGEYAARKVGAALWATNNTADFGSAITAPARIGCQYQYANLPWAPTSPVWALAKATGLTVADVSDVIHVNMAGNRFIAENTTGTAWTDAALAINSASTGPDYAAGPVWAIFDSAAVTREKWTLGSPNTDPAWFFQANDLATLAQQINTNPYMVTPLSGATLAATVAKFNSFVVAGKDTDFGRPVANLKYQINTPPYYAASFNVVPHDCLTGVKMDTGAHVVDLDGNAIPHLYVAGESAGGFAVHGLTKCMVFGLIAGQNAAKETST
jgi:FAD binding domain-containing protein